MRTFAVRFCCLATLLLLAAVALAPPPAAAADRAAVESVVAPGQGETDAATALAWGTSLDQLARGIATALADPAAVAALREAMAGSPLPENTVLLVGFLDAPVAKGTFGGLMAKGAGVAVDELRAALAGLPEPITLYFPRDEDRASMLAAQKERIPAIQVTWDPFWISEAKLGTFLAYDRAGRESRWTAKAVPAGPVLVVSTENAEAPEAPKAEADDAAPAAARGAEGAATSCQNYLLLTGIYLRIDHEGFPRGAPEIDLFRADWSPTVPGTLVIQPTTSLIFSGRNVTDAAGRTRYLPDVNDERRWYTISPPLAVAPYDGFLGFGLYLVEDDTTAGALKVFTNYSIGFSCTYSPGCTGPQCSGCKPTGTGIVNLVRAIAGGSDDRYDVPFRSVGGVGSGGTAEADMTDWRIRFQVDCG